MSQNFLDAQLQKLDFAQNLVVSLLKLVSRVKIFKIKNNLSLTKKSGAAAFAG